MFCPNCGNDCADARFCVQCGTKLGQEVKETEAWSVGMPCPHCGGTQLEGHNCAFCGAQLVTDVPERNLKQPLYPPPPMGRWYFRSESGFLEMGKEYVRICKGLAFPDAQERLIPYSQIVSVFFSPGKKILPGVFSTDGVLVIRTDLNRSVPIPKTENAKLEDPFCAFVPQHLNWYFHNAYCYLQLCAEINMKMRGNH